MSPEKAAELLDGWIALDEQQRLAMERLEAHARRIDVIAQSFERWTEALRELKLAIEADLTIIRGPQ